MTLRRIDREITSEVAYAVSKIVLTTWARTQAPKREWLGSGICMNVVAPAARTRPCSPSAQPTRA